MKVTHSIKNQIDRTYLTINHNLFTSNKKLESIVKTSINENISDFSPIDILEKRVTIKFITKTTLLFTTIPTAVILGSVYLPVSVPVIIVASTIGATMMAGGEAFLVKQMIKKHKKYQQLEKDLHYELEMKNSPVSQGSFLDNYIDPLNDSPPAYDEKYDDNEIFQDTTSSIHDSLSDADEIDNRSINSASNNNVSAFQEKHNESTNHIDETEKEGSVICKEDETDPSSSNTDAVPESSTTFEVDNWDSLSTVSSEVFSYNDLASSKDIQGEDLPTPTLLEPDDDLPPSENPDTKTATKKEPPKPEISPDSIPTSETDKPLESILSEEEIALASSPTTPANVSGDEMDTITDESNTDMNAIAEDQASEDGRAPSVDEENDRNPKITEAMIETPSTPKKTAEINLSNVSTHKTDKLFGKEQQKAIKNAYKNGAKLAKILPSERVNQTNFSSIDNFIEEFPKIVEENAPFGKSIARKGADFLAKQIRETKSKAEEKLYGTNILDQMIFISQNPDIESNLMTIANCKTNLLRNKLKHDIFEAYEGRTYDQNYEQKLAILIRVNSNAKKLKTMSITEDNFLHVLFPQSNGNKKKQRKSS